MVQKEVRKKTKIYGTVAVLSAIVLVTMVYALGSAPIIFSPSQTPLVTGMKTFSSIDELKSFLAANLQGGSSYGGGPLDSKFFGDTAPMPAPVAQTGSFNAMESAPTDSQDYSTTNIQVTGVDEADTVKTDGQYIYAASTTQNNYYYYSSYSSQTANSVYILNADPQNAKVVSKITLGNDTQPAGLFLSQDGNKLVILASKYQTYSFGADRADTMMPMLRSYYSDVYTFINVYDVSNKANPFLTRNFTVSGSYFNSRMIGNYVYAVTSQDAYVYNDVVPVPAVYSEGKAYGSSPTSIYYADMNQSSYYSFTSFYGIDVADDQRQPTNITVLLSGASTMYVSPENIYVAYPNWVDGSDITSIYRVKIDGLKLTFEAQGGVPGNTINQYAMDEYNGNLRIATNLWQNTGGSVVFGGQSSQINNVYVLNQNLSIVGKLEGLAQGENLHSVRFIGDKGYLVTFIRTDPLFVIDLSQPANPKVLGELKIPGYSDYLHPYDETHLIGLGKEAVDAEGQNFAWYQGLKLSLFDVSNVNNPVLLANFTIGERGTDSAALTDPKAFLFEKSKNLLVIPVNLAIVSDANKQQGSSAYGDIVWQGAYVFSLTTNGGFTLKGTVTHIDSTLLNSQGQLTNSMNYYNSQNQWITRSLYIGNTLYTISNAEVKLNNLNDMTQIAQINLK